MLFSRNQKSIASVTVAFLAGVFIACGSPTQDARSVPDADASQSENETSKNNEKSEEQSTEAKKLAADIEVERAKGLERLETNQTYVKGKLATGASATQAEEAAYQIYQDQIKTYEAKSVEDMFDFAESVAIEYNQGLMPYYRIN